MLREEPDAEGQTRCGPTQVGTQRSQSHTDRKWGPGPPGGRGVRVSWGQGGSWEDGESWRWWWRRLHSRVTVPNAAELCAEKR